MFIGLYPQGPFEATELKQLSIIIRLGATYRLNIGRDLLFGRRRIADGHNPYLTPRMLHLQGMRPREECAQLVGDVVDNLLDRHAWVNEVEIEHETVIMSDGNAVET